MTSFPINIIMARMLHCDVPCLGELDVMLCTIWAHFPLVGPCWWPGNPCWEQVTSANGGNLGALMREAVEARMWGGGNKRKFPETGWEGNSGWQLPTAWEPSQAKRRRNQVMQSSSLPFWGLGTFPPKGKQDGGVQAPKGEQAGPHNYILKAHPVCIARGWNGQ